MANSFVRYTGNNSTTAYSIPFSYRSTGDLTVTLAGSATTAFTLNAAGTTLTFATAPGLNVAIEIRRTTSQTTRLTDYASGSVLTENDLDTDSEQAFFMSQEAIDDADDVIKISNTDFQYDATNKRITNVADPVNAQDLATKNYLENTFLTTANKTALTTINANIANIIAVNNNATNINSAVSNATNINTVATNIGSVNTVAADIAKVIEVANDLQEAVSEVETVADDLNETTSEIDTVATSITNVDAVGNNIANVNAVAGNATNINAVNSNSSNINTVAGNNTNINTVAGANANITTLAGINANITTVAGINSNVSTVAGISSDVTAVAGISSDVQAVENIKANVTTVAGISSAVSNVSGISSAVSAVNSNSSNINAVNSNSANINTVASNNSNISTVAGVSSDVTTVAGIASDVSAVENIASNVTTVAGMSTAINTINSNATNVNAVSGAIANVNLVGGSIANVNTVATNLASVNAFGETYRIASSAPTTSLNSGDLYFNTSTNVLNVYGASGWQNAGSSVNGTSERFKFVASGTPTTLTGNDANGNTLAYDAGFIDVYLNGIKMVNGTDVTVTSGSSIVFASALTNGDIVEAVTFGTFSVANLNASNLTSGTVPIARLGASGTKNSTTFLRGDNVFATPNLAHDTSPQLGGALDTNGNNISFGDNDQASFGDGFDLQIYHDGTDSYVRDSGTGNLKIRSDGVGVEINKNNAESMAKFLTDGAVELYHDNSKKLETTSSGATVTGTATVTGGLTVDTDTLFVDSSNNRVGIGTNSPGFDLVVKDASGAATIRAENGADNKIVDLIADSTGGLIRTIGSYPLVFNTNQTERGRFDASGNFLLNTTDTDPTGNNTKGFVFLKDNEAKFSEDGLVLDLNRIGSDGGIIHVRKDGTQIGAIGAGLGQFYIGQNNTGFILQETNQRLAPSNADGSGNDATITLGWSNRRWKDIYLSGGVFLGGTGTANKLDDYEEGTWTPAVTQGSLGDAYGYYTKIGDVVNFTMITGIYSDTSSSSHGVQLTLPFTSQNENNKQTHCVVMSRYLNISNVSLTGYINQNTNKIEIFKNGNNSNAWSNLLHSELNSTSSYLRISGFFYAN